MDYYGPMMNWYGGGFAWAVLWPGFFVLVALLAYRLIKNWGANRVDALDVVKGRYAKGEINKEEFDQLKKDLKEN